MKKTFNERCDQICHLAEQQAEDFAQVVTESFDDLDSLGEFVDTLLYMHSITDDGQFAVFLGIMHQIMGYQIPETIDFLFLMEQEPHLFTILCHLFLAAVLNQIRSVAT